MNPVSVLYSDLLHEHTTDDSVEDLSKIIEKRVTEYERPKRKAISSRFPVLVGPAVFIKTFARNIYNQITLSRLIQESFLTSIIARHSSLLYRKLGDSDENLQRSKVTNLEIAISKLNGLVIPPGETFSLWHTIGTATKKKGYVEGMVLSNGKVSAGIGGGLCQLSNFLFWIFLHADTEIIERHHHSVDAFPDSGRTLPFGSGATIFSNYLDLKIKNVSGHPLQIKLWLTETCLKGQLLSDAPAEKKFHVFEKNHCFAKRNLSYFRYNEIYREVLKNGVKINEEKIAINFAPVIYPVTEEYFESLNYTVLPL